MKHNWIELSWSLRSIMQQRIRVCRNPGCLAIQEHATNHEWMRVVGYYWHPKVGRCGLRTELGEDSWKVLQVDDKMKKKILREVMGRDCGIRIYAHPADETKALVGG